jgi:hypothetical protein
MDEKTQTTACGKNVSNLLLSYIAYTVHCDATITVETK